MRVPRSVRQRRGWTSTLFAAATFICVIPAVADAQAAAPDPPADQPGVAGTLTLNAASSASDPAVSVGILAGRPTVSAIRTSDPPSIDGRLDDAIWRTAARVTTFVQQRPLEGAPATEQTEVHIAYDSQNIYFGIYAHYSDPGLIRASRVDRDQTARDDTVRVYFDPFLDQQRAYVFAVNGYGVQSDAVLGGADAASGTVTQQTISGISAGSPASGGAVTDAGGRRGSTRRGILDRLLPKTPPQNHTSG